MSQQKYAIIGTGALGGYYGGKLAHAGKDVHFLLHSDYEHVKQNGLQVDSVNGDFLIKPANAYNSTTEMPVCDVILVCLKTINNHLLKTLLPPLLHENSLVILVQNGLGIEQNLASDFPNLGIAGGLAFICSSKIGNGHIGHFDFGSITLGIYQNVSDELSQNVVSDFNQAGITTYLAEDLNLARWKKLVWNIPYNGMTVILNTTTDAIMNHPSSCQLIRDLMVEVVVAGKICGAQIPASFVDEMLESTNKMTPYAPSMKLDYDAHRQMEIEAIYSNPVKTALANGYKMNKVEVMEQQLRFIQSGYLK